MITQISLFPMLININKVDTQVGEKAPKVKEEDVLGDSRMTHFFSSTTNQSRRQTDRQTNTASETFLSISFAVDHKARK